MSAMVMEDPEPCVSDPSAGQPGFAHMQGSGAVSASQMSLLSSLLTIFTALSTLMPSQPALQLNRPFLSSDPVTNIEHLYPSLDCQI